MLAAISDELPPEGAFLYEPKWDGFRAIVYRGEGDDLYIQSRELKMRKPSPAFAATISAVTTVMTLKPGKCPRRSRWNMSMPQVNITVIWVRPRSVR